LATPEDRLELRAAVEIAGLDGNYAAEYPERVRAVTLDDTRRVMRQHLSPRELEICIVSTAAELRPWTRCRSPARAARGAGASRGACRRASPRARARGTRRRSCRRARRSRRRRAARGDPPASPG